MRRKENELNFYVTKVMKFDGKGERVIIKTHTSSLTNEVFIAEVYYPSSIIKDLIKSLIKDFITKKQNDGCIIEEEPSTIEISVYFNQEFSTHTSFLLDSSQNTEMVERNYLRVPFKEIEVMHFNSLIREVMKK